MRLIHKHPGGRVVAIPGEDDLFTGRPKRSPVVCDFKLGPLHPWEVQAARDSFRFRGTYLSGIPGSTGDPVDTINRVSIFDTCEQGWTDELRETVEKNLLSHPFHGVDFVHVDAPDLPAPWPKYDDLVAHGRRTIEMVAEKIAAKVKEDGYDAEAVIAYERSKLNRAEVVNALIGIENTAEDEVEVLA